MRSRMVREGSVGLLVLGGVALLGGLFVWLRGIPFRRDSYLIVIEFEDANRLSVGSPVRFRGVGVGTIEGIRAGINDIDVTVKIESTTLAIPRKVQIFANQSGLIGESSIDMFPTTEISLPNNAQTAPLSSECNSQIVVCAGDRIEGEVGASIERLIRASAEATELLSDPELYENLNQVALSAKSAIDEFTQISRELADTSTTIQSQIEVLTQTADATVKEVEELANTAESTVEEFGLTAIEVRQLVANVNGIVNDNSDRVATLFASISDISQQLSETTATFAPAVEDFSSTLSAVDVEALSANLAVLTEDAAAAAGNLRLLSEELSAELEDPATFASLQQALDSARVTFANAQKITSDLEELTGNPEFRNDIRELLEGLSDLVSTTRELDRHLQLADLPSFLEESQDLSELEVSSGLRLPFEFGTNPTSLEFGEQASEKERSPQPLAPGAKHLEFGAESSWRWEWEVGED